MTPTQTPTKRRRSPGERPADAFQMMRVRRDAHAKGKAAAQSLGMSLEEWASQTLEAAADLVARPSKRARR